MPYYIPNPVSKTSCIGNSLSTFNTSFTSLDTNLYELSTYTVASINYLSATMISVSSTLESEIEFLSATMISVSSTLESEIQFLSSVAISVSSTIQNEINYLSTYNNQGVLYSPLTSIGASKDILWNTDAVGVNAKLILSSTANLSAPTGLVAGEHGTLVVSATSGVAITFASDYKKNFTTPLFFTENTLNKLDYYYDGTYTIITLVSALT